jgi:hypothetical protein
LPFYVTFGGIFINPHAADEVARRPDNVFLSIDFGEPIKIFSQRRRLTFHSPHHIGYRHLGGQIIPIKANRLYDYAGYTSTQF